MESKMISKYFKQKRYSVMDIIFAVSAIASLFVAVFVWGGGPIGFPIFAVSVAGLCISRSMRVKDEAVDHELEKFLSQHQICLNDPSVATIATYDLQKSPIKKGRDGKLRSPCYWVTTFGFERAILHIAVLRVDLLNGTIQMSDYPVSAEQTICLAEQEIPKIARVKKNYCLSCPAFGEEKIPVCLDSVEDSDLINRVCAFGTTADSNKEGHH